MLVDIQDANVYEGGDLPGQTGRHMQVAMLTI